MRITVYIPDHLEPKLRQAAQNEGISLSALTAKALQYYLKRKREEAGNRLLGLIGQSSVSHDAREELERGRTDDRA